MGGPVAKHTDIWPFGVLPLRVAERLSGRTMRVSQRTRVGMGWELPRHLASAPSRARSFRRKPSGCILRRGRAETNPTRKEDEPMSKRMMLFFGPAMPIILAVSVQAQAVLPITVNATGLNCTAAGAETFAITSYTLSAVNPVTALASGVGRPTAPGPTVGPIIISKSPDGCSPALLHVLLEGRALDHVTLMDSQKKKKVVMQKVTISLDRL